MIALSHFSGDRYWLALAIMDALRCPQRRYSAQHLEWLAGAAINMGLHAEAGQLSEMADAPGRSPDNCEGPPLPPRADQSACDLKREQANVGNIVPRKGKKARAA